MDVEGGGGRVRKVVPALEGCSGINMAEQNGDHLLTLWLECKGHRVIRVGVIGSGGASSWEEAQQGGWRNMVICATAAWL